MSESNDRPSLKNEEQYIALRDQGMSKEKAARIANTNEEEMDRDTRPYEERNREELYEKAQEVGIEGRSHMTKDELIDSLRNH